MNQKNGLYILFVRKSDLEIESNHPHFLENRKNAVCHEISTYMTTLFRELKL
jgi:hypothetical protein